VYSDVVKNRVEIEINFRPTVSRAARLGVGPLSEQIVISLSEN
jgi:hypothetical protein